MYEQFYGFSGKPFQLTPDPQFYFESATHRKALSYLGYGLAQSEGFIIITGEVGSGKSTLVGHLMQTVDKARLTVAHIVTSQLDGNDLVHMAAESFGIATAGLDKPAVLKAIEEKLHAEARAGRRSLLIVDEAQNLGVDAIEELRMLSNFQLGSQPLLQIFLLGQPEFRDLVQNSPALEQLRQRVIATHHLEAMEASEVEPYIIHRLSHVGWQGKPDITAEAFAAIFAQSDGVPRKINTLMNRVFLMASIEQVEVIDAPLIEAVVADMAGQPFEYTAPIASKMTEEELRNCAARAEAETPLAEPVAEENVKIALEVEAEEAPSQSPEIAMAAPQLETYDAAPVATEDTEFPEEDLAQADFVNAEETEVDTEFFAAETMESLAATMAENDAASLQQRIDQLETRVADQDEALRRVLGMMIDFMNREQAELDRKIEQARAA